MINRYKHIYRNIGILVGVITFGGLVILYQAAKVDAQPIYKWSDKQITLGWNNPTFDNNLEYDPSTSSAYIKGQWPLSRDLLIKGTLPWIHYQRPDNRASLIGNPSIGLQKAGDKNFFYQLEVVVPVVDDPSGEAAWVGSRIRYPERQRFFHKMWAIRAGMSHRQFIADNFYAEMFGALETVLFNELDQANYFLDYRLELRYEKRQIHYDLRWEGSFLAGGSSGTFGDEMGHTLQLGFGYKTALVDPRLHVSLPLNNRLSKDLQFVMGISLTIDLDKLRWPGDY